MIIMLIKIDLKWMNWWFVGHMILMSWNCIVFCVHFSNWHIIDITNSLMINLKRKKSKIINKCMFTLKLKQCH
jgi:hypothetical protein